MKAAEFTRTVGVPLTVAVIALVGSLTVAAIAQVVSRCADANARRRDGYASVLRTLVAYAEYPWRIRRRTSDEAEDLRRLAEHGHKLQEDLAYNRAWVQAEKPWVAETLAAVQAHLAVTVGMYANQAWHLPPITSAADMALSTWGPTDAREHLVHLERAIAWRFGWRRLVAAAWWRPNPPAMPGQVASKTLTTSSP
jgi:hypothetical protein